LNLQNNFNNPGNWQEFRDILPGSLEMGAFDKKNLKKFFRPDNLERKRVILIGSLENGLDG
jgi:hypothetical protein